MYDSQELFKKALYDERSNSVPNFLELYEQLLLERGDDSSIAHSNRLFLYRKEITNKKYLHQLRTIFNDIYKIIDKEYPDLRFSIEGRRKGVVSLDRKIIKNISTNKSLDSIRDTNAFRIILFGESTLELISLCYAVMNSIIRLNQKKNFALCNLAPVPEIENIKELHPEILIPKTTEIADVFSYGIKDYIAFPKENGYQSLHCVFRNHNGGECFEVQVRTFDMHVYAESGNANHKKYKQNKYDNSVFYDRSKIHIPGYGITPNEEIFDFIGFEKSLEILKRQKTF